MTAQLQILNEFPIKIPIIVAWGEMDAYAHVNNAVYFKYFESAQVKYFDALGLNDSLQAAGLRIVIHKISCTYMIPITYPDNLQVGARITDIQDDMIFFEFFILSEKRGLSAFGESTMVVFNFKNAKKVNVPDELVTAIKKLENKNL
jgi:acyl-CoA thioester hydrolase